MARARAARAPEPIVLRIDASAFGVSLVDELKSVFENFPGEAEVMLEMETREGLRCLRFGYGYRVRPSRRCTPSSTPCSDRAPRPPSCRP